MKPDLPGALRPERPSPRALACEAHCGPPGATSPNGVLAARTVQAPGAVSSAPRARPRSQSTAQGEMAPSTLQVNPRAAFVGNIWNTLPCHWLPAVLR